MYITVTVTVAFLFWGVQFVFELPFRFQEFNMQWSWLDWYSAFCLIVLKDLDAIRPIFFMAFLVGGGWIPLASMEAGVACHGFRVGLEANIALRTRLPPTEKEGFGSKDPNFPSPHKRAFRDKKSLFSFWCPVDKWGFLLTQRALFWADGKWGSLDPETLSSRFWGFLPL